MRIIMSLVVFLALLRIASGQEPEQKTEQVNPPSIPKEYFKVSKDEEYSMAKFALSINPLGFVQFGPLASIEIGVAKSLVLNAHVRFPSLGLITYVLHDDEDGLDELSGISFGAGPIHFFGKKRSKPYAGILLEYEKLEKLYAKGDPWEWDETDNTGIFVFNGGYRFRFKSGFFINTGLYLGAALTSYKWNYTDPSYVGAEDDDFEGTDITPFGMVEVTVGIEF
jgi:hypothetical protein